MTGPLLFIIVTLLRIAGVNRDTAILAQRQNLVRVCGPAGHFHAGGADRHTRHTQADDVRFFSEHPQDLIFRDMAFNNVAINDGCMAGLGLQRDFVVGFYLGELRALFRLYDKADIFQMLAPTAAAASARGLVNLDRWQRPVVSQ